MWAGKREGEEEEEKAVAVMADEMVGKKAAKEAAVRVAEEMAGGMEKEAVEMEKEAVEGETARILSTRSM